MCLRVRNGLDTGDKGDQRRHVTGIVLGVFAMGLVACKPAPDNPPPTAGTGGVDQQETVTCPSTQWAKADNGVEVNYGHIFCGQLNNKGRVVGFHARPQGKNPPTVGKVRITQPPNRQGLYAGEWERVGHTGENKFSTFYPDHCTPTQVINTIGYAARHPQHCPQRAPDWAWCGANAPPQDTTAAYCHSADGTPFLIVGASSSRGGVNTAFPLR